MKLQPKVSDLSTQTKIFFINWCPPPPGRDLSGSAPVKTADGTPAPLRRVLSTWYDAPVFVLVDGFRLSAPAVPGTTDAEIKCSSLVGARGYQMFPLSKLRLSLCMLCLLAGLLSTCSLCLPGLIQLHFIRISSVFHGGMCIEW